MALALLGAEASNEGLEGFSGFRVQGLGCTQRAQYPLIKEYSLNHNKKPYII